MNTMTVSGGEMEAPAVRKWPEVVMGERERERERETLHTK